MKDPAFVLLVALLTVAFYYAIGWIFSDSTVNNAVSNQSEVNSSNSAPNNSGPNDSIPNNSGPNDTVPNNSRPNNTIPNSSNKEPGQYVACPSGSWDSGGMDCDTCTQGCILPNDQAWPDSQFADHVCCQSG